MDKDFEQLDRERQRYIIEVWEKQQEGPDTPPDEAEEDEEDWPYDIV